MSGNGNGNIINDPRLILPAHMERDRMEHEERFGSPVAWMQCHGCGKFRFKFFVSAKTREAVAVCADKDCKTHMIVNRLMNIDDIFNQ